MNDWVLSNKAVVLVAPGWGNVDDDPVVTVKSKNALIDGWISSICGRLY